MKIFKLWLPAIIWTGLIFYLSGIPDLKTDLDYDFLLRKIAHITEYLILTVLLYRAFKGSFSLKAIQLFIYPASLSILYAVSDEVHQSFVPGRVGSLRDVLIDSIGVLGFFVVRKIFRKQKNRDGLS